MKPNEAARSFASMYQIATSLLAPKPHGGRAEGFATVLRDAGTLAKALLNACLEPYPWEPEDG